MQETTSSPMTALEKRMLEAFERAPGRQLTRRELGRDLERNNGVLHPYDIALIDRLIARGYLEMSVSPTGPVKTVRIYRRTDKAL